MFTGQAVRLAQNPTLSPERDPHEQYIRVLQLQQKRMCLIWFHRVWKSARAPQFFEISLAKTSVHVGISQLFLQEHFVLESVNQAICVTAGVNIQAKHRCRTLQIRVLC